MKIFRYEHKDSGSIDVKIMSAHKRCADNIITKVMKNPKDWVFMEILE